MMWWWQQSTSGRWPSRSDKATSPQRILSPNCADRHHRERGDDHPIVALSAQKQYPCRTQYRQSATACCVCLSADASAFNWASDDLHLDALFTGWITLVPSHIVPHQASAACARAPENYQRLDSGIRASRIGSTHRLFLMSYTMKSPSNCQCAQLHWRFSASRATQLM